MENDFFETNHRIKTLRQELKNKNLTGFIVPRQDEFQGEYVAPYAERLRWLTGFAGSWGMAIVLKSKAAIFIDGRYTIQVTQQVNTKILKPHHLVDEPPAEWLAKNLKKNDRLGFDPWLLTAAQANKFSEICKAAGATLVPVAQNLIDRIWHDQPSRPSPMLATQPQQFAGASAQQKLKDVAEILSHAKADATVLTLPDSVSWVMNIRGADVPYTPVVLAFAILKTSGKAQLFVDIKKLPEDVVAHLKSFCVVKKPSDFETELKSLGAKNARVQLDQNNAPAKIVSLLKKSGAIILQGTDPCVLPKATKNQTEREGARAAHQRDGVAMVKFLRWLDEEAPHGKLTEWSVAEKLHDFRKQSPLLMDLSFDTIAGAGPNAAIPHYHVNSENCLPLRNNEIFLIDSGGQYQDGTTDITRTIIVGQPTDEMKDRFTRVLKGMIGVSMIRFPVGTCGAQIDVLARASLWAAGLDYDHGTGHGVGAYLSVHEGPARINKSDRTPLKPGMILSNEPGYYKANAFGIRIENLLLINEPAKIDDGERMMLAFETLTLAPIDQRLINQHLLTKAEVDWLNTYHTRVLKVIGDHLSGDDLTWLQKACARLN